MKIFKNKAKKRAEKRAEFKLVMDVKENVFFKVKKTKKRHLLQQKKQPKIANGINLCIALPCGKVSLVKGGDKGKGGDF